MQIVVLLRIPVLTRGPFFVDPSQPEPVTPLSEGQFTPSSPSRSLFRQGHCSSRVSSDSGMYDRDDYRLVGLGGEWEWQERKGSDRRGRGVASEAGEW